jgi:Zn-dependent hydrolases, including glyoxylases
MLRSLAVSAIALSSYLGMPVAQAQYATPAPATSFAITASPGSAAPGPGSGLPAAATAGPSLRLHALDCGRIQLADMGMFSDTGEYDGRPGNLVAPCFVIVHPSGTLLWDTGLGDDLAGKGAIQAEGNTVLQVNESLTSQLQRIGISRIDYVGFSHFHFDHTGNANAFRNSTWLVNAQEMKAALAEPHPFIKQDDIRPTPHGKQVLIDGDHDVFGDGSVTLLKAPGHTPGHHVLLVRLPNTGPVILSGDLYHTRDNRRYQRVPTFNTNRADTLASMNRIETLVRNLNARIIIQHDPEDFAALPQPPGYLD